MLIMVMKRNNVNTNLQVQFEKQFCMMHDNTMQWHRVNIFYRVHASSVWYKVDNNVF